MTRTQQLAEAYRHVARVNHYMVGIVDEPTDAELQAAKQLLISEQNVSPTNSEAYGELELALDLIEAEERKRGIA